MSRIENAIKVAAQKRSQAQTDDPATRSLDISTVEDEKSLRRLNRASPINIDNPRLVTANDQGSPASEQYRKLKSRLVNLSHTKNFENALMVTSSVAGEGKTVTSINLAIAMAQDFDHSVLLVEADIRKPNVMNYLGLKSEKGLADCVMDGLDPSNAFVKTGIGSLSILPAGRHVENPVELFSSNRMQCLFDELRTRFNYRYIIVDTTPLLPFAEPRYLANMLGAVVLVVREGTTTMNNLKSSLEILKDLNLLGVVSNCVSQVDSLKGYYGYYGYHRDH
jgi:protein-tyrosine kinase